MTILCAGNCHVYLGSASICTCEAARMAMMYGFPANYNPFGPHAPGLSGPLRQPPTPAPDVPQSRLTAAERAGATHLSGDGETAYDERQLGVWRCFWYEDQSRFGSWYRILQGGLPIDAVKL